MTKTDHLKEYRAKIKSGEIKRPVPLSPIEKSKRNPKSLRYAITAMCFDCSGYSRPKVKKCEVATCPLHSFRPWQNKKAGI